MRRVRPPNDAEAAHDDEEDAAEYPDAVDEADATSTHPDSEAADSDSVSDDHTTRQ